MARSVCFVLVTWVAAVPSAVAGEAPERPEWTRALGRAGLVQVVARPGPLLDSIRSEGAEALDEWERSLEAWDPDVLALLGRIDGSRLAMATLWIPSTSGTPGEVTALAAPCLLPNAGLGACRGIGRIHHQLLLPVRDSADWIAAARRIRPQAQDDFVAGHRADAVGWYGPGVSVAVFPEGAYVRVVAAQLRRGVAANLSAPPSQGVPETLALVGDDVDLLGVVVRSRLWGAVEALETVLTAASGEDAAIPPWLGRDAIAAALRDEFPPSGGGFDFAELYLGVGRAQGAMRFEAVGWLTPRLAEALGVAFRSERVWTPRLADGASQIGFVQLELEALLGAIGPRRAVARRAADRSGAIEVMWRPVATATHLTRTLSSLGETEVPPIRWLLGAAAEGDAGGGAVALGFERGFDPTPFAAVLSGLGVGVEVPATDGAPYLVLKHAADAGVYFDGSQRRLRAGVVGAPSALWARAEGRAESWRWDFGAGWGPAAHSAEGPAPCLAETAARAGSALGDADDVDPRWKSSACEDADAVTRRLADRVVKAVGAAAVVDDPPTCTEGRLMPGWGGLYACTDDTLRWSGPARSYHPDGRLRAEGAHRDGERTGTWRRWRRDGTMRSVAEYREGRRVGSFVRYHDDGETEAARGQFAPGGMDGRWTYRWPDGQRSSQGALSKGRAVGDWLGWAPDGALSWRGRYRRGRSVRCDEGECPRRLPMSGELGLPGRCDREDIGTSVAEHEGLVRSCYESGLARGAKREAKITVTFRVTLSGRTRRVKVVEDTVGDAEVARCVAGAIRKIKFPAPEGVECGIKFPFRYSTTPR